MGLSRLFSRTLNGVSAHEVIVEVHLASGLPAFSIVGLPEAAVKESKDRVRAALINCGFEWPAGRVTVNLAPADLPKEGGRFDLPIAIGILIASDQLPHDGIDEHEFLGELSLAGELRAVRGVLPSAVQTVRAGRSLILASGNVQEAQLVKHLSVQGASHLLDVCALLRGQPPLQEGADNPSSTSTSPITTSPDLAEVHGQAHAKRALEIAAAGGHSLLMIGPPGTGKTMLASRLPGLLPPLTDDEALEVASLYSISHQGFAPEDYGRRPFRNPHHTASGVALVGGGSSPRPGEVSLAHNGILFLDELTEFDRRVLEVLREPLENGHITISRATQQADFPARFQFIAAMNPCPCGYLGDPKRACGVCTREQINRYRGKISGPILDRIDMHIEVPRMSHSEMHNSHGEEESSAVVQQRVIAARQQALNRAGKANTRLSGKELDQHCALQDQDRSFLEQACESLGLSARAWHRILRMARTIADLADSVTIETPHLSEALSYRRLDRG